MRLFIAVDPGPAVTARLERAVILLRPKAPSARWVAASSLHVTLAFLGEIADPRAPDFSAALGRVAARHAPLSLRFRGGGAFGAPRKPRVLWVGIEGDRDRLSALQRAVVSEIVPLGYTPEARGFSPHLTLARARAPGGDPALVAAAEALREEDFGEATIAALVLYRSDLTREGARYTPIATAPLA